MAWKLRTWGRIDRHKDGKESYTLRKSRMLRSKSLESALSEAGKILEGDPVVQSIMSITPREQYNSITVYFIPTPEWADECRDKSLLGKVVSPKKRRLNKYRKKWGR